MATNRFENYYELFFPGDTLKQSEAAKAKAFLYKPIVEKRAALLSTLDDDESLKRLVTNKVLGDAQRQGIQDRDEIGRRMQAMYTHAMGVRGTIEADERSRLKRATRLGGMAKPETVVGTEQQRAAMSAGKQWFKTPDQVKADMLEGEEIPDDILEQFTMAGASSIATSTKIPEEYRIEFQERLKKPQFGPPSSREGPAEGRNSVSRFFTDVGLGILDVLGSTGRFAQGTVAGYMERDREYEEKIAATGNRALNLKDEGAARLVVEELDKVGAAVAGGVSSMFMLNDAPQLASELGRIAHDYKREAILEAVQSRSPEETQEQIKARADNIFQRLLKEDFNPASRFAIEHPGGTQLATEIIGDPVNYFGIGAITGPLKAGAKVTGVSAAAKAVAKTQTGKKVIEGAGAAARQLPGVRHVRSVFYHSIDNNEDVRKLGEFGNQIRRGVKAAEDAGGAAKRKVRVIGGQIDELLSKASDRKKVNWRLGDEAEEITESEALFRVLDKGEGIENLPEKLQQVVHGVKKLSDELYDMSARRGQLNKVVGGAVTTAAKVTNYVPYRVFEGVGDIGKRVREAGFADINAAATAVKFDTLRKRSAQIEKSILVKQKQLADASGKHRTAIQDSIDTLKAKQSLVNDEFARMNQRMADVPGGLEGYMTKSRNLDKDTRRLIHQLQLHANRVDVMGRNALHRINPTSWAAVARKGGARPIKDARVQWKEHIKRESATAGRAEEVATLNRVFGKELKGLRGGNLVHVRPNMAKENVGEAAAALSEQAGLHYSTLSPDLKRAYLQLQGKAGTKVDDYEVFVPQAMAARLNEVIPKLSDEGVSGAASALKDFNEYILQPANSIFRTSTTVLRSLAFHATNMTGAVGLGFLAHGLRAFNPKLQFGAARGAFAAAFSGSPKALKMQMRLGKTGESVTLGKLFEVMDQYGVVGQAGLRFGKDLAVGKGPAATVAGAYHKMASATRLQQLASFGDDYQHAVAFLGYMTKKGSLAPDDIYKALDFTAEYAGNYNRLTKVEKGFLRDVFAFYSWNRFILPHVAKQVVKNPQRLAVYEKMRMAAEYQYGKEHPTTGMGVPDYLRLSGSVQAPETHPVTDVAKWGLSSVGLDEFADLVPDIHLQPESRAPGSHEFGMVMMEFPIAGLSALAPGYGGRSAVEAQLGPGGVGLLGMLTGFDVTRGQAYTGEQVLPGFDELKFDSMAEIGETLHKVQQSQLGSKLVAFSPVPFSGAMVDLSKLYMRHGMDHEAADLWLRYKVGRDWFGIDNVAAKVFGAEPMSISTHIPGAKLYAVDPIRTAKRRKARAVEGM